MKILALTKYFPPEIGTASHLFFELCETLVQRGHQVTAITSIPWYNLETVDPKYNGNLIYRETMNGIRVLRLANPPLPDGVLKYQLGHVMVPPVFCLGGILEDKHDVVINYSPPLLMGLTAYTIAKIWHVPFVFNAQDLYPQCLIDLGQLRNNALIWLFEKIEAFIYKQSTFITVHSEGNREFLEIKKEVPAAKVQVVSNWVDTDMIQPEEKDNDFSHRHALGGKFIVSFAGTMGISQGIVSIVEACAHLQDYPDILLLMVGGGVDRDLAAKNAEDLHLKNIKFLPMQPRNIFPQILASSAICLVPLKKNIKTPVIPSKILSIMAAGRPVLASMPLQGDAPKLINEARCGICVEPENPKALAEAILRLYHDRELGEFYGRNGRKYAVEHFSRQACVAKYEALFQEAINQHRTF